MTSAPLCRVYGQQLEVEEGGDEEEERQCGGGDDDEDDGVQPVRFCALVAVAVTTGGAAVLCYGGRVDDTHYEAGSEEAEEEDEEPFDGRPVEAHCSPVPLNTEYHTHYRLQYTDHSSPRDSDVRALEHDEDGAELDAEGGRGAAVPVATGGKEAAGGAVRWAARP